MQADWTGCKRKACCNHVEEQLGLCGFRHGPTISSTEGSESDSDRGGGLSKMFQKGLKMDLNSAILETGTLKKNDVLAAF